NNLQKFHDRALKECLKTLLWSIPNLKQSQTILANSSYTCVALLRLFLIFRSSYLSCKKKKD
ncbi:hypothetical protein LGW56_08085, partial [Streptococcus mutans]|nr:hypothetical protein [Streptococcus mutans]